MPAQRHILILIHGMLGGGAERVSANLATTWAREGDRVTVATLRAREPIPYELPENVRLIPLDIANNSRGTFSALVANLRRVLRVRRLLREERPDIAIGMMTTSAVLLAFARDGRTMRIGSERNYPPMEFLERLWHVLRRLMYRRLDAIVAQTQETRTWILENTNARHVVVIPNSIHLPLPVREPLRRVSDVLSPGKKMLLSVGRLADQKGFDKLLRAFGEISSRHADWQLVILGEGELRSELERQVEALGLRDRVKLPGWAGNLADWYHAADLYAMTSRFEGFPNVLLEAMAHGRPVLSVDCDTGPRDLILNGTNGILVPQGVPAALSEALDMLMSDDDLRARLASQASRVREIFSPEGINTQWRKLFALKS